MMKTTEPRAGQHYGVRRRRGLDVPAIGCIFLECIMNAVVVMIAEVIANESAQVDLLGGRITALMTDLSQTNAVEFGRFPKPAARDHGGRHGLHYGMRREG
jgi:hypothetical protein